MLDGKRHSRHVAKSSDRGNPSASAHATGIAVTLSEKDCTLGWLESSSPMITGLFSID